MAEALLHPEREPADPSSRDAVETGQIEHLVHALLGEPVGGSQIPEVAACGAGRVETVAVQHGSDHPQRLSQLAVGMARDQRPAAARSVEPDHGAHRGGLAGPVGSQEAGDDPGRDLEGEIVERVGGSESSGEVLDLDHDVLPVAGWVALPPGSREVGPDSSGRRWIPHPAGRHRVG